MGKTSANFLSIPLLMIVLLAGCNHPQTPSDGGRPAETRASDARPSETPRTPAGAPSQSSTTDSRPLIVAFGDSLTAGYGTGTGESYPDDLQRELDARGYRYRVINAGRSGNTTKDGVARVGEIAAERPAVVILSFGGNDGLRGIPIHDTEMNLRTMITALQAAHAKVILGGITLPPNYGSEYIAKFDAIYAKLAREYHVALLPFMLKDVYGVAGDMQEDGIHATAQGNRQVAKNFLPLLLPLLRKRTTGSRDAKLRRR